MSENDYIAEYIKEKYPQLLGFDFAMWKLCRQFAEALTYISKGIKNVFSSIFENKAESEGKPNDDNNTQS